MTNYHFLIQFTCLYMLQKQGDLNHISQNLIIMTWCRIKHRWNLRNYK